MNANGKIAYIYNREWDPEGNDIFLCKSFWFILADGQEVSQSGVVLHEMSHLADEDVLDINYGKCSIAAETPADCPIQGTATVSDHVQTEDTVINADNYHLFAANLEKLVSVVRSILDPDKGTRYLVQLRNSLGQYVQADPNSGAVRDNARAIPYTFILSDTKGDSVLKDGDQSPLRPTAFAAVSKLECHLPGLSRGIRYLRKYRDSVGYHITYPEWIVKDTRRTLK